MLLTYRGLTKPSSASLSPPMLQASLNLLDSSLNRARAACMAGWTCCRAFLCSELHSKLQLGKWARGVHSAEEYVASKTQRGPLGVVPFCCCCSCCRKGQIQLPLPLRRDAPHWWPSRKPTEIEDPYTFGRFSVHCLTCKCLTNKSRVVTSHSLGPVSIMSSTHGTSMKSCGRERQ